MRMCALEGVAVLLGMYLEGEIRDLCMSSAQPWDSSE